MKTLFIVFYSSLFVLNSFSQPVTNKMSWWEEAKFGMFIHWGVYAVPAGTYDRKQINDIGEWIMQRAKIPVADYKAYAKDFNPVKYDPEAWANNRIPIS